MHFPPSRYCKTHLGYVTYERGGWSPAKVIALENSHRRNERVSVYKTVD